MLAHELRSPIAAIRMAVCELARYAQGDPELRSLIHLLRENAERALAVADDVAELFALESGVLPASSGEVDLVALVRQVIGEVSTPGPQVVLDAGPGTAVVRGDVERLGRVIAGLVAEAGHRARSRVAVTLRQQRGFVGVDIAADDASASSAELEALLAGEARPGRGLGIRLGIARGVIAAHGGVVDVAAGEGGHAHVSIWLPALTRACDR